MQNQNIVETQKTLLFTGTIRAQRVKNLRLEIHQLDVSIQTNARLGKDVALRFLLQKANKLEAWGDLEANADLYVSAIKIYREMVVDVIAIGWQSGYVARVYHNWGNVLVKLAELTGNKDIYYEAIKAYHTANSIFFNDESNGAKEKVSAILNTQDLIDQYSLYATQGKINKEFEKAMGNIASNALIRERLQFLMNNKKLALAVGEYLLKLGNETSEIRCNRG